MKVLKWSTLIICWESCQKVIHLNTCHLPASNFFIRKIMIHLDLIWWILVSWTVCLYANLHYFPRSKNYLVMKCWMWALTEREEGKTHTHTQKGMKLSSTTKLLNCLKLCWFECSQISLFPSCYSTDSIGLLLRCMLHNFAANVEMYGVLDAIGSGPIEARMSENSTMASLSSQLLLLFSY